MTFHHRSDAGELEMIGIPREIARREFAEFWRELARPVTFFDEPSPSDFPSGEIGAFFRKWRARQDSNLRPPA